MIALARDNAKPKTSFRYCSMCLEEDCQHSFTDIKLKEKRRWKYPPPPPTPNIGIANNYIKLTFFWEKDIATTITNFVNSTMLLAILILKNVWNKDVTTNTCKFLRSSWVFLWRTDNRSFNLSAASIRAVPLAPLRSFIRNWQKAE